jgi:hypothetical protein
LAQFFLGDLSITVFVSVLHSLPGFGGHFILGEEAVAVLVLGLKVRALSAFTATALSGAARTLSWSTLTTWLLWRRGLVAASWWLRGHDSTGKRKCEEGGSDECEYVALHFSVFLSVSRLPEVCRRGQRLIVARCRRCGANQK